MNEEVTIRLHCGLLNYFFACVLTIKPSNFSRASLQTDPSWKDTLCILRLRADGITPFDDKSHDKDVNCVAAWIIQENLIGHELGNGSMPLDLVSLAQERITVPDSMKFSGK